MSLRGREGGVETRLTIGNDRPCRIYSWRDVWSEFQAGFTCRLRWNFCRNLFRRFYVKLEQANKQASEQTNRQNPRDWIQSSS